mmetsp:Transcript_26098/g.82583  ORF Transcript_26098/g.82583 Transcript_26098/m.82583 type:complete len:125 (+) Transcript_26098:1322-1696(+)
MSGQHELASRLWREMQAAGVEPDVASHAAAVQACNFTADAAAERAFRASIYKPWFIRLHRLRDGSHRQADAGTLSPRAAPDLGGFSREAAEELSLVAGQASRQGARPRIRLRWGMPKATLSSSS